MFVFVQMVRVAMMLSGLATVWFGIYILLIGAGTPIEFIKLETSGFSVSGEEIPSGLAISVVGLALIAVAAHFLKYRDREEVIKEFAHPKGQSSNLYRASKRFDEEDEDDEDKDKEIELPTPIKKIIRRREREVEHDGPTPKTLRSKSKPRR